MKNSFGMIDRTRNYSDFFVYYNRLDDYYPLLKQKAKDALEYRVSEGSDSASIAKYFFKLRDGEFQKETALLYKKLRFSNLIYSYDNKDNYNTGAELIKAFNTLLNVKEIFERNLALITQTNGQRMLSVSFGYYFKDQLNKDWPSIKKQVIKVIESGKTNDTYQALWAVIHNKIPNLVQRALRKMMKDAGLERGLEENESLRKAYQALLPLIEGDAKTNPFIQSFVENTGLNQFIGGQISAARKQDKTLQNSIDAIRGMIHVDYLNTSGFGGMAQENFIELGAATALQAIRDTFGVKATGRTKQAADVVIGIGIPNDMIERYLNENTFNSRTESTKAMAKLEEQLKAFDDGFIVFVNSKAYNLNTEKFSGYKGGVPISLNSFKQMFDNLNVEGNAFIYAALQLIPGAIGSSNMELVNTMFSRLIATTLFNDFNTMGVQYSTGANSIHLLNLNGVYFPMSFYYHLLGEAFQSYSENIKTKSGVNQLIRTHIAVPSQIMFKTDEEQRKWQEEHQAPPIAAWREQRNDALKRIQVSYVFLAGFKKIIEDLNIQI